MKVDQPRHVPTNKLTAAMLGTFVVAVAQVAVQNLAPGWDQPYLWVAAYPMGAWAAGYLVRDEDNTPAPDATTPPAAS